MVITYDLRAAVWPEEIKQDIFSCFLLDSSLKELNQKQVIDWPMVYFVNHPKLKDKYCACWCYRDTSFAFERKKKNQLKL